MCLSGKDGEEKINSVLPGPRAGEGEGVGPWKLEDEERIKAEETGWVVDQLPLTHLGK